MLAQEALVRHWTDIRLETSRLVIREVRDDDFDDMLAHELNRDIMEYIRDPAPKGKIEEKVRDFCAPWDGSEGRWIPLAIEVKNGSHFAGILCWQVDSYERQCVEIGYRLHPDFHGQGYASEAARALIDELFGPSGVRRIVALCLPENEPSWRLMERLGMTREAELREYSQIGGRWADELIYGLLAHEWTPTAG